MSFILNALRKSEQERQARQAENVTDKILLPQAQQTGSKTTKLLVFLLVANVAVIAGIVWLLRNNATPPPGTTAAAQPGQQAKLELKITDNPIQPPKQEQETEPATISIAELIDKAKPEPAPLPIKPAAPQKPAAEIIKKPAAVTGKPEPKPLTASEIAAAINEPDVPEATPMTTPGIPFLSDLPFEFRQSVPKFTVNVFVYAEAPEERFVMIDMVKYTTGQQIKDAMLLKEILPDSFVVDYQNRVFRIKRP